MAFFAPMESIQYDFTNVLSAAVGEEAGLQPSDIDSARDQVLSAHQRLSEARERGEVGFFRLPDDQENVNRIFDVAKKISSKYENLLVLGIGGSALGLQCLTTALLPPYYNLLPTRGRRGCPRLFICDNIDPDQFEPLLDILDWRQTSVNVISKSGRTTETMAQFFMVRDLLIKKYGKEKWGEHVTVTTDPATGPLRRIAKDEGLASFDVPVNVGGRYSVFSSVGLLPAACVGIDIKALLQGAREMRDACSNADPEKNPAYKNGLIHYLFDKKKGMRISVVMAYSDGLKKFTDWYVQLFAESLGKEGQGPTPVGAVGATDQHSQLQLYMEGPCDKLMTIIGLKEFKRERPLSFDLPEQFEYIAGRPLKEVFKAEERATAWALKEAHRPHVGITLEKLDEYNLGALLMAYQIQVAFTGLLYGVNPFNQPGVELGKKITKEILSENS